MKSLRFLMKKFAYFSLIAIICTFLTNENLIVSSGILSFIRFITQLHATRIKSYTSTW